MNSLNSILLEGNLVADPEAPTAYIELIAYDTRTQEARHFGTVTPEKLAAIEALLRQ